MWLNDALNVYIANSVFMLPSPWNLILYVLYRVWEERTLIKKIQREKQIGYNKLRWEEQELLLAIYRIGGGDKNEMQMKYKIIRYN